MQSRSIAREISLLVLGQIYYEKIQDINKISLDNLLLLGLETLLNHWREELDACALKIETAQQKLLDSELCESDLNSISNVRNHLKESLIHSQDILNDLSDISELTRLLTLSDQEQIRNDAIHRVTLVTETINDINLALDNVMEGWRLKRLPRIDQDILRLAFIDIYKLKTPTSVACNEAVNLANRYSDEQGRKMINGILRRLQNTFSLNNSK